MIDNTSAKACVIGAICADNWITDSEAEAIFADSLCGHDDLKVNGEVNERDAVVIYIDSNEDNKDEGDNNFHGYDKVVGDM